MDLEKIKNQALRLQKAVIAAGGMSTKSFLEDWLMAHNEGLAKVDARYITNHIEFYALVWPEGIDIKEYPDVKLKEKGAPAAVLIS